MTRQADLSLSRVLTSEDMFSHVAAYVKTDKHDFC